MQPGLVGPEEWVEFYQGLPDFGERSVVVARVISAAIRTRDQTFGASIDIVNLRVHVPFLIRNGLTFLIFLGQSLFAAMAFIMKGAASLVTGRCLLG